jgi:hypothetical protein
MVKSWLTEFYVEISCIRFNSGNIKKSMVIPVINLICLLWIINIDSSN